VKISLLHFSARSSLTGAFIHFARERKMPANELEEKAAAGNCCRAVKSHGWNKRRKERAAFSLFIICGGRAKLLISKIIGPLNSTAAHTKIQK
jgi:hypothetical protein